MTQTVTETVIDEQTRPRLTVIIPFRNRGTDRLRRAATSIMQASDDVSLEIIVSDYGSDNGDEIKDACDELGVGLLRTEADHWNKSICVNSAVGVARGELVQTADVDMIWAPGSLRRHVELLERTPGAFINSQVWDLPESLSDYALNVDEPDWDMLRSVAHAHSRWGHGLVLAPKSAYERIGGLDERMHTYGGEDIDVTKRLRGAGWRQIWVGNDLDELFHIWHERIPDSKTDTKRINDAIEYNRNIYYNDKSIARNLTSFAVSNTPLVSVVIVTRNRSAYIRDAINSALYQTVSNIEVVVVDDGSTDNTQQVVVGMAAPRVRYFARDHNGIASARNYGTRMARGFYIAVLDDDDIMRPDRLEIQLDAIEPGVQGCLGNLLHFSDDTGETHYFSDAEPSFRGTLPSGGFAGHPSWLVEREVLEQIPYDESLTSAIDNNVALRAIRSGFAFAHCHEFVTLRRMHGGQVTVQDGINQKTGARLSHIWLRHSADAELRESAQKAYWGSVERPNDAEVSSASLRMWLPNHLINRTVLLDPGADVTGLQLNFQSEPDSAISVVTRNGEQIGQTLAASRVTWDQLVALRERGIPHRVEVEEGSAVSPTKGLLTLSPGTNQTSTGSPWNLFHETLDNLLYQARLELDANEYLVSWLTGSQVSNELNDVDGFTYFDVEGTAGRARLNLLRVGTLVDVVNHLGSAECLVRVHTAEAQLRLSYIHRKAIELEAGE